MAAQAPSHSASWPRRALRWIPPLLLVLGGVAFIALGHGHVSDVTDAPSGSVFTQIPTDRHSLYSAVGVSLIIIAGMWVMLAWFISLNSRDGADRAADEAARDYYARTGRWPGEAGPRGRSR